MNECSLNGKKKKKEKFSAGQRVHFTLQVALHSECIPYGVQYISVRDRNPCRSGVLLMPQPPWRLTTTFGLLGRCSLVLTHAERRRNWGAINATHSMLQLYFPSLSPVYFLSIFICNHQWGELNVMHITCTCTYVLITITEAYRLIC